jgi:uncharacterized protein YjbJ (UPF0337 family)
MKRDRINRDRAKNQQRALNDMDATQKKFGPQTSSPVITPNSTKKNAGEKVSSPSSVKTQPPLKAAEGDDDLMSQDPRATASSANEIKDKDKWRQYIGSAKVVWTELSEDELLQSQGHEQNLTNLIQERYGLKHEDAVKQVKSFIKKYKS